MKLILWRHASADTFNGYDRMLDPIGHRQAEQGGIWLNRHYPDTPIWVSLAKRAQETAAYYPVAGENHHALNPGKKAADIYQHVLHSGLAQLIIVGHLPWIGRLAAMLNGNKQTYYGVNHGMILVFTGDENTGWQLSDTFQPQPVSG